MSINIRILRACWIEGTSHPAGAIVSVGSAVALAAVESGRCELADKADAETVREARQKQVAAALKGLGYPGQRWRDDSTLG
jgi:hypothetical protein